MSKDDEGKESSLVSSWLGRSVLTAALAAEIAVRLAAGPFRRLLASPDQAKQLSESNHEAIARRVVGTLGQLKGAAMKFGQMASYMNIGLPENIRKVLEDLQDSVPAIDAKQIERVVREDLGKVPQQVFAQWSNIPTATASIGQVYRAMLKDGTLVAVKVQYPDIVRALMSDLSNASIVGSLSSVLFRENDSSAIVEEIKDRLLEECDYEHEAKNQEYFASLYRGDRDILIPKVCCELSSKRVLTTYLVEGQRFNDFVAHSSQKERNHAGQIIHRMAYRSIFQHHLFNCDPHPGNYLFLKDSRVAFIDFGCVKRFRPDFIDQWRDLLCSVLEQDRPRFEQRLLDLRIAPRREGFDFDYQYRLSLYLYRPWIYDRPFRYTHDYVRESFRVLGFDNPNLLRTNVSKDFVFVNRLQWGLNSVLAILNAEANWRREMLSLLYDDDTKRWPPPHQLPTAPQSVSQRQ
jgi:predicted unusual protein kinase regulating ubiquinone biosynthesis (AarF/ABC1/UbiB family)